MPQPTWIFDLDNTLHHASRHAFPVIDSAMTAWLQRELQLQPSAANQLRQDYWRRYGATLLGLIRHHPHLNPHHFLAACHPLPQLLSQVHPMPQLKSTLARLTGDKIVFTNGPIAYAQAMLAALNIERYFIGIAAIDTLNLTPKPIPKAYHQMLRQFKRQARDCIMVEDSIDNLITAKKLGMQTVWLRHGSKNHPAADRCITQLKQL
ncbi:pyrimidine 5'-nucleotidase [Deefgea salmonis]|uniref:Pyrimidine 5'-nucleotidase n=1 Tax=Deefgea salmonis TaxID=2875502 RepID=A0ABS8BMJ6_9NEIS|nr:pyrimidine 5'-nucleotidase [Deefgea salmonis]MCB5196931.1 pyrimidine 5'-nucleotidase [Deefgea salmonis]